jgi:hypothetical protein
VFSIDQETYALRRLVLPTDDLRRAMERERPIDKLSLVADFIGASFNGKIDPRAFQFQVPEGAKVVDLLIPPQTAQLLGEKSPDFKFQDLDGKPVTPQTLAGRPAVLVFWTCDASGFEQCVEMLRIVEKAGQLVKSSPAPVLYAVCVDPKQIKTGDLAKAVGEAGVRVPILRAPDPAGLLAFRLINVPTLVILDAKGTMQYCETEYSPRLANVLPGKLARVVSGADIYPEAQKAFAEKVERIRNEARAQNAPEEPAPPPESTPAPSPAARPNQRTTVHEVPIPAAKTAPRSAPEHLKLSLLWKCSDLKSPGNILVAPGRLLVVENARSIAEVGLDGKVIAVHQLNLAPGEYIGHLRAAEAADGKRCLAAFLWMQQRCHVLDEKWNVVCHYPEDALQYPHNGITDVELGDLAGDGNPKLLISYAGVVGVQEASLDGHRLWSNRQVYNVFRLAIGGPDPKGRRDLLVVDGSDAMTILDGQGGVRGQIGVAGLRFRSLVSSQSQFPRSQNAAGPAGKPAPPNEPQWCGMAAGRLTDNVAVGLSLDVEQPSGAALWRYSLPIGLQPQPIEPVIAGRLARDGRGVWLLPGPDGSIHILSPDGHVIDHFNYGVPLQGLATVEIDGRPALVIATATALEAWRVE